MCPQQALGRVLGLDKSNVARLCAKMEAAGHVHQARSETDGRARLLTLTASGRALAERVEASSRGRFESLLAALPSAGQRAAVLASFKVLNDAIAHLASREESA